MKYAFVALLSLVLLVSGTSAAPVDLEEAPEDVPKAVALTASHILDQFTDLVHTPPQITNVIDGPKLCPEGQKLDHQGKCRPILG
uniref:Putative 6.9 kDa salivary secreted peptide n=1 Tax=Anopheles darlingi TaxID=43151 RepID=B6DE22_ANODA